jgi:hypothetical protein
MPTATLPLAYRPVRIGFVVRQDEMDDIIRAATICTQIWGGMNNILLSVGGDRTSLSSQLTKRFGVDFLAPVVESEETAAFIKEHERIRPTPFMAREDIVMTTVHGRAYSVVDMNGPLYEHWRREVRHGMSRDAFKPFWRSDDPLAGVYSVLFGRYPEPGDSLPTTEKSFELLVPRSLDLSSSDVPREMAMAISPIRATNLALRSWRSFGDYDDGVVIGDASSVDDLIDFWNLRASGADVSFWPSAYEGRLRDFNAGQIELVSNKGSDRVVGAVVGFLGVDDPEERVTLELPPELVAAVPADTNIAVARHGDWMWSDPTVGGPAPRAEQHTVIGAVDTLEDLMRIHVQLADPPFPDALAEGLVEGSQYWVCSVEPYSSFTESSESTLSLPFLPELNEWYARQMTVSEPFGLRVQPDGFDLIRSVYSNTLELWALNKRSLAARLFELGGLELHPSTPGHIADRVIGVLGGMRGSRFLRIPGVRKLLESERARTGITPGHATEIIKDRQPQSRKTGFDLLKESLFYWRQLTASDVLSHLLAQDVFRPGLRGLCPNCRLTTVIEADQIGAELTCPACAHRFSLATHLRNSEWVLSLSGVFQHESRREGAIPCVLTMGEILRSAAVFGGQIMLTAHDVKASGLDCETDFIYIELDRHHRPSVCIGECKGLGQIDEQDITNLVSVRKKLRDARIECYLAFGVLRPAFFNDEIAIFKRLLLQFNNEEALHREPHQLSSASGPVLFTSGELEADPWEARPAPEGLPHSHPHGLRDLAENSAALYLY